MDTASRREGTRGCSPRHRVDPGCRHPTPTRCRLEPARIRLLSQRRWRQSRAVEGLDAGIRSGGSHRPFRVGRSCYCPTPTRCRPTGERTQRTRRRRSRRSRRELGFAPGSAAEKSRHPPARPGRHHPMPTRYRRAEARTPCSGHRQSRSPWSGQEPRPAPRSPPTLRRFQSGLRDHHPKPTRARSRATRSRRNRPPRCSRPERPIPVCDPGHFRWMSLRSPHPTLPTTSKGNTQATAARQ